MSPDGAGAPTTADAPPWLPAWLLAEAAWWPLRAGARALAGEPAFPPVSRWEAVLTASGLAPPGVRFERQAPIPRRSSRRRATFAATPGYDASIVERGVVPSREGSWHDLLNALVWHAFPRAKAALHARQLAAQRAERVQPAHPGGAAPAHPGGAAPAHPGGAAPHQPPGVRRVATARGPHRDALALLDEGGVLLGRAGGVERRAPFGHALYEERLRGPRVVTALVVELVLPGAPPGDDAAWLVALDAALAAHLALPGAFAHPAAYPRVVLGGDGSGEAA